MWIYGERMKIRRSQTFWERKRATGENSPRKIIVLKIESKRKKKRNKERKEGILIVHHR